MKIGIYNRHLATLGGGERYSLAIADVLSREHDVTVLSGAYVKPAQIAERLAMELSTVRFEFVPKETARTLSVKSSGYDLFINASNWDFFPARAPHSAMVVYFPLQPDASRSSRLRYQVGRGLNVRALRPTHRILSAIGRDDLRARIENVISPNFLEHVRTYDQLWSISAYVQQWTRRYWEMPSELLYPSVAVERFTPGEKKRRILNVGRFFAGNHNKKHLVMVKAFARMLEEGLKDWELHLAGSVNQGTIHEDYLEEVRAASRGLPIFFHTDISFEQLQTLYAGSAIYWHASGYGEDPTAEPRKFEHFGIATVEAKASGCVPVVIGRGGQPELITHETDGFLWYTEDELQRYTFKLINDPAQRQLMSQRAVIASRRYDQQRFEQRLSELLQQFDS